MSRLDPRPVPGGEGPLLAAEDPLARLPILILYPHARCNCRCVMCDIWRLKEPTEISAEHLAAWLPDLESLGTRRVVLSGGEALMHSRLWDLCGLLRGRGIGVTLLSSGLLLARDAARIVEHVDDLVVSLDGPRDVHDAIRNVPRAFDRLAAGVAAVRALAPELSITARCTVQRANAARLVATARAAHAIGFSKVSFLAVDTAAGAFLKTADTPDLAPEDLDALAREIDALARELPASFLAEDAAKLRVRLLERFRAARGLVPMEAPLCNAPWVSSVVEADGTLRPCFFQPPIGNVHEAGGLLAALNSEKARAFRRQLDVSSDPICRRCVCSLALREGDARSASSSAPPATSG